MRAAGEATRERILDAALQELLTYGAAGARINRIARSARASKERLYAYFPSKEALFAAAVNKVVVNVAEDAGLTAEDVPGYAGRLFDVYLAHPEYARVDDWLSESELPEAYEVRVKALQPKVEEIRRGQDAGLIAATWQPVDLVNMMIQVTRSMALPRRTMQELGRANDLVETPQARRAAVVEAIRRLVTP